MNEISVVMPTFNRAHVLNEVLPTYLCQDNLCELIIVDDGSTDDTAAVASRWQKNDSRVRYTRHDKKMGLPAARNTGIAAATGQYVFNGEDDVVLNEDTFFILLRCLSQEKADIVGCRTMYMMSGETKESTLQRYNMLTTPFFDLQSFSCNFGCSTKADCTVPFLHAHALIKKQIVDQIKFDIKYWGSAYREETDFFIRCSKAGYRLVFCPQAPIFNVPRAVANPGGAFAISPFLYELSAITNNWRLLNTHYAYLHDAWGLKTPCLKLQMRFTIERLKILYDKLRPGWFA